MQFGNRVPDSVCGQCKKTLQMAVLTEAVYHDGLWFHTACHRAGADQLYQGTRLSEVLQDVTLGVESITAPLLQGDEPPV